MTKRTPAKAQPQRSSLPLVGVVIALAAVAVIAAILLTGAPAPSNSAAVADLTPQNYVSQFAEASVAHYLLDVRTPEEFAGGHIANAANIAVETLAANLAGVPKDVPVVVYCRSGNRSAQAAQILSQAGYTQIYDLGGIIDWQAAGYAVET
ncbi:MAG: rhodanese-like domain-containing protein [Anaerolineae bacterium]|nr:rhodanese-like domain-containing protein [Anaerolineae bacterium]NUQ03943.1 rhodanese-like domain-containing protein [Anaerolineae bacterium]